MFYSGILEYLCWDLPWTLKGEFDPIDLRNSFWPIVKRLKGKGAAHNSERDAYTLFANKQSGMLLDTGGIDQGVFLSKESSPISFSNVTAYLESTFFALNGRHVVVVASEDIWKISAAAGEDVPAVKYKNPGNSSRIPEGMETAICKIGHGEECCVFFTAGSDGFSCSKFDSVVARSILDRKSRNELKAGRIGNCRNIGREDRE